MQHTYRLAGSTRARPTRGRPLGFTLVELMVALAILAIVAAVATPLYTNYSQRTYAAEAQADLLSGAQALERFASVNFTYQGTADTDGDGAGDADAGALATEIYTPRSAALNRYAFTVNAAAGTFTLTATPQTGPMSGTGLMTIDEAGNRRWDRNNDGDFNDTDEDNWEAK